MKILFKIFKLLNKKEKISVFFLVGVMILIFILEIFSIGTLFPFINYFTASPEIGTSEIYSNNIITLLKNFFSIFEFKIIIMIMMVIFLIKNFIIFLFHYLTGKLLLHVRSRIVYELYKKYLYQNYNFFLSKYSSDKIKNIQEVVNFTIVLSAILVVFSEFIILTGFVIFLLFFNFYSTIITFLTLFLFMVSINIFSKSKLNIWGLKRRILDKDLQKKLYDSFIHIKDIKIFNKEDYFLRQASNLNFSSSKLTFFSDILLQCPRLIAELVTITVILGIVLYNIGNNYNSEIFISAVIYLAILVRLLPSVTRITANFQKINYLLPVVNLIDSEIKIKSFAPKDEKKVFNNFELLELKNVSFRHESKTKILSNINLKIKKNTITCLIGNNGSGKTTLLNLIAGLLEPTKGKILVNNFEIKNNYKEWRKKISFLFQNALMLDDSIVNNIIFGSNEKKFDKNKFYSAINNAGLKPFFNYTKNMRNNKKLSGEMGSKISGGQMQKLALARIFYRDSDVIIFDEFEKNLDYFSQQKLLRHLIALKKNGKTIIIVSHKKNILKYCDCIFRINKGILKKINYEKK